MAKQTFVSFHMVRLIKKHLTDLGKDFEKIRTEAGILPDTDVFNDPDARLPAGHFLALFLEAEKASGDPFFGLNLGREMAGGYPGRSVLLSMMANCPTVGKALDLFFRYHNLTADALQPCMRIEKNVVIMSWKVAESNFHPSRQITDMLLSLFSGILALLAEGRIILHEVRFNYPKPENTKPYAQRFQAPLVFDHTHSEMLFDEQFLSLPVPLADASLLETLEAFAQRQIHRVFFANTWSQKVADCLSARLIRGVIFDLDAVAKELGVSTRSLQEKLNKEGASYRQILAEVRKKMALDYLKDYEMNLCDIAFLIGFSEQSAFNRAFKRWTGFSPKAFLSGNASVKYRKI